MSFQLVVSANMFWAAEWDPMVGIGETLLVEPGRLILNSLLTWGQHFPRAVLYTLSSPITPWHEEPFNLKVLRRGLAWAASRWKISTTAPKIQHTRQSSGPNTTSRSFSCQYSVHQDRFVTTVGYLTSPGAPYPWIETQWI